MPNVRSLARLVAVAALAGSAVAADVAPLTGTWQIRISSPQGVRTPSMQLTQDGARLTGTYHSMRNGDAPIAGSLDGQQFVLKVRLTSGDHQLDMEYKGRYDGATLAGVVVMGARGETPFTATRAP